MNSFPPPPPPPPLLPTFEAKADEVEATSDVLESINKWHQLRDYEATCLTMWTDNVPTLLQQGPQCGLVALVMAAQALGHNVDTQSVFEQAVKMGITKQGEMFSAAALCQLANDFSIKASMLENSLSNNIQTLLDLLNQGKLLLVPYDADANHSPCFKNGHKAHWALIIGFVLRLSSVPSDSAEQKVRRVNNITPYLNSLVTKEQVHFLAKHGKSKRLAIWDYASLAASNANLFQVDPKRNNPLEYVLPEGSDQLGAHLNSKIIVLGF